MMDSHRLSLIEIIPKFDTVQYSPLSSINCVIFGKPAALYSMVLFTLLLHICYVPTQTTHFHLHTKTPQNLSREAHCLVRKLETPLSEPLALSEQVESRLEKRWLQISGYSACFPSHMSFVCEFVCLLQDTLVGGPNPSYGRFVQMVHKKSPRLSPHPGCFPPKHKKRCLGTIHNQKLLHQHNLNLYIS